MFLIYRYLLKGYLKNFLLTLFGFIALLLVTRLKEIARFAAIASSGKNVLLYTLYQIPHILPFAIPISCLIAAVLLFNQMSQSEELTALRSCGFSLASILAPLFGIALFLSFLNFFICSEVTTRCRIRSKEILFQQSSVNPIMLLQRQNLLRIKNSYIDMEAEENGIKGRNLVFIMPNRANHRLYFLSAEELQLKKESLQGRNISFISHLESPKDEAFDSLFLENEENISTSATSISHVMKSPHWSLNPVHLPLPLLLVREKLQKKKNFSESIPAEITRRFSLAFSTLTFTLIGCCFGVQISRTFSRKKILYASFLALFLLLSFAVGKSLKYHTIGAMLTYLLPQPIALLFAFRTLKKISGGVE